MEKGRMLWKGDWELIEKNLQGIIFWGPSEFNRSNRREKNRNETESKTAASGATAKRRRKKAHEREKTKNTA